MRRSRQMLRRRGGRLVQFKLDDAGRRALAALELTQYAATRDRIGTDALTRLATEQRFPLSLSRDEEIRLAMLATSGLTIEAFRALGYADSFLAGLAVALAGDRHLPRERLLSVATTLAPHVVNEDGYRRWIEASPISLPRLFKLVDAERAIAAAADAR
jgi:hypothetical protein